MSNVPTYLFVALVLAAALGSVLTAQSGGRRDYAQEHAQDGAIAIGLRLASTPAR